MIITGSVFLKDDGKSVYDGAVTVKATGQVVRTNIDGTFSVNVPDFDSILVFDFAGLTLPKELPARDVTGQVIWLEIDPAEPGAQIQVKKDYKIALWGIGIGAIFGIAALVILASSNSKLEKKEVKAKEVEV